MRRGGKRAGAGRKKGFKLAKTIKAQVTADAILKGIGEDQAWKWAAHTARKKRDVKTYVDILKYLTDRRDGKARQALDIGNDKGRPFQIISRIPRPIRDGSAT